MFEKKLKKKGKKVVVLGLDGVPYSLLNRFADDGTMPNVGKLRDEGTLRSMTASIPEVSSTSWSTFMTGVNPGRHGIYGFMELEQERYSWKFPNFNDLKSRTLWERAGNENKKSIVLNVPSTYPARPLSGMLVSGFVALDLKKASYPDKLFHYLNGIGYKLDVDASKAAKSPDDFVSDLIGTLRKRIEAFNYLYEKEEWDLFIATITETDRLHHYFWEALDDLSHAQHDFFINFYRELDTFIGNFYKRVDPDIPFVMLSDHGFTGIKKEINLNAFLQEKNYLRFDKPNPESFSDMSRDSRAFVLDPSRVYIHKDGKYSRGCVQEHEYHELRNTLKKDLLSLSVNGEVVLKNVFFKEELYNGNYLSDAPDLILLSKEGFDLKGTIKKKGLSDRSVLTGCHTRENAMFYINRKVICHEPNIIDVGSTVLQLLGIPTDGMEGKPLL